MYVPLQRALDLAPKAAGTATRSKRQDFELGAVPVLHTFCESISPIARFHFVLGKERRPG